MKHIKNYLVWNSLKIRANKKEKYYFSFDFGSKNSNAILSQVRLIDAKRLKYKIGYISNEGFKELKEKLKKLIF